MEKLTAAHPETRSPDLAAENAAKWLRTKGMAAAGGISWYSCPNPLPPLKQPPHRNQNFGGFGRG